MSTLASRDRVVGQRMFPNLDAYRAIGMVMIMTMHVTFASGLEFRSSIGPLFARMEVGVPIFFMVSGFLLYRPHVVSVVTGGPHMPARTFLRRRALRIVPAYWFALVAIALLFGLPLTDGAGGLSNGWPSARMWFLFLTLLSTLRASTAFQGIAPAWSIGVEVGFYLMLPVFARAMRRFVGTEETVTQIRRLLGACVGLYALGQLWRFGLVWANPRWISSAIFWFPTHVDMFAVGMGLAVVSVAVEVGRPVPRLLAHLGRHPGQSWIAALLLWLVVVNPGGVENHVTTMFARAPGLLAVGSEYAVRQLLYGGAAFFFLVPAVFGPQSEGMIRRFLSSRPMVWGGAISYAFYLWHVALLDRAEVWTGATAFHGSFWKLWILTFGLSTVAGALSHYLIERPFLELKNRPWSSLVPTRRRTEVP